MRAEVQAYMNKSKQYVMKYKHAIMRAVNASDLLPCEGEGTNLSEHLDVKCGMDYIIVSHNNNLSRGVGCRVQEDSRFNCKYNTFTIRKERESGAMTEFEKRKLAINMGGLYPYLTVHIYIDTINDRIDRMAFAKTAEIIKYCESGKARTSHTRRDQVGQAEFYYVDWDEYKADGNAIAVYRTDNSGNLKLTH